MPKPTPLMAKADFITGLGFFLLGVYMVIEGLRMPGAGGYIEAGGEPGRVPIMLGCIISLLALVLLIRSVKSGGHRLLQQDMAAEFNRSGLLRGLLTAGWCGTYALVLLGLEAGSWRLSYPAATALFLFVFIVGFEWQDAREFGARRWAWLQCRLPAIREWMQPVTKVVPAATGAYLWLFCTAGVQAGLVTWIVTYLFEQKFYVQLP